MTARLPAAEVERMRRSRREPSRRQYDYLHLRRFNADLAPALRSLAAPGERVLDVWCGSRPYDDLFAPGVRVVGLDISDRYGTADLVSDAFLPGDDGAYDAATCIEAFHYVADPVAAARELRRVVRPGGRVLVSAPLVYEYDRTVPEHRYTTGSLRAAFAGWEDVEVVENGGRAISWAWLTGSLLRGFEHRLARGPLRRPVGAAFAAAYVALNALGAALDRVERDRAENIALAPNLMLTATRPLAGP